MPVAPSILIVDSDSGEAVPDLREREKYSVVVVKTGQEALSQVQQRPYDLVLLNRKQPDKETLSLLRSLKQGHSHCPIIILTSLLDRKDKSEFLKHGAFDCLIKPYAEEEFHGTLGRALEFKTARRVTEHTIRGLIANGERYRAIVQAAQDGIVLGDRDGSILSWNQAAQNMFKYTAEEVVGKPLTLLMPHRYRQAHQQGLKRIQSTGETRVVGRKVELHGLKKGGEEFPIELSLSRSVETEEVFYCGIIRDISERRLAEQALKDSEERFRKIFANSNDAIFVLDLPNDRILTVNPRACMLLEYPQEELLSLPITTIHGNDIHKFQAFCDSVEEKGQGWTDELSCRTKSGRLLFCEISASVLEFGDSQCLVCFVRDHSARRETEQALVDSEKRFHLTLNNINDAVFFGDLSGKILWVNQQALDLFDRPLGNLIGYPLMDCLSDEAAALAESRLVSVRAGETVSSLVEFEVIRPDGTSKWIEANVSNVVRNEKVVGRLLVGRDITQRMQAEKSLSERNALLALDAEVGQIINRNLEFRDLLQGCTEAIVRHLDAAFARIWTLNVADQVLELQASAGLYTHLDGPHSRVQVGHLKIGKIASEKKPHLTNTIVGDPRIPEQEWAKREGLVAFAGFPLVRGHEVIGVMALFSRHPLSKFTMHSLGMVADRLTTAIDRQRALEKERMICKQNEQILGSMGEGIFGLNVEGKITFVNPIGAKMLGNEVKELIGTPIQDAIHHTKPDGVTSYPRDECLMYAAVKNGQVYRVDDEVLWRKDGTSFPIEFISTPMWEDGQLIGAVVSFQDITERQRLAAQLVEEAKLSQVTKVLGDIGHDIKNMLMPILNGAKLIEEELHDHFASLRDVNAKEVEASRNFTKDAIDMIVNNGRRIQERVREIADAVKGVTSPLRLGPCQITDIVESVFESLRLYATEKGILLRVQGLALLPPLHADHHRLFNALYNLVNNAIPETSKGGMIAVCGSMELDANTLVLQVVDTGKGMPPEIRDSLFTEMTISGKPGGTGLGTKIVKDVVDIHGGTITVDSEQGKGTTFTMKLPLHCQLG